MRKYYIYLELQTMNGPDIRRITELDADTAMMALTSYLADNKIKEKKYYNQFRDEAWTIGSKKTTYRARFW